MKCAATCECNYKIGNTGSGCVTPMAVEKKAIIVNEVDSLGVLNYIDLATTLNDAYFIGKINATDPLARFCFTPEIKDVTDVRDKPVMFEWKDGTQRFVRDGVRKFEGMFPPESASPQLLGILEGQRCTRPCKFTVDANGTIWGRISSDGTKLYPVKMDAQSVAPLFVKPTDGEPTMMGYGFNYHPSEKDCALRGLQASELIGGITPLSYEGLQDVFAKVIDCDTTALEVKLYTLYGNLLTPSVVKALIVGDMVLFNVTQNSAIALTGTGASFAENTAAGGGTYTLTYATADQPTAADVLRLTPTKNGWDFAPVVATAIVVS